MVRKATKKKAVKKVTKDSKSKDKYVQICPNCGSPDFQTSDYTGRITGGGQWYKCNVCHYQGKLFPEVKTKHLEPLRKKIFSKGTRKLVSKRRWEITIYIVIIVIVLISLVYIALRLGFFDFAFIDTASQPGYSLP